MCYSAPVSISYFAIMLVIIIYLFKRNKNNDRFYASVFFFVNLVQFGEYFIWKNLKNPEMNRIGSKIIKLAIYAQPLALFGGALYFGKINPKYKVLFNYIAYFYIFVFGIEFANILFNKSNNLQVVKNSGNHLNWKQNLSNNTVFNTNFVGTLYLLTFAFLIFDNNVKRGLAIAAVIYLMLAINYFQLKNNDTWKSMWCFLGNFTPIIYLFITSKIMNLSLIHI